MDRLIYSWVKKLLQPSTLTFAFFLKGSWKLFCNRLFHSRIPAGPVSKTVRILANSKGQNKAQISTDWRLWHSGSKMRKD
jgi:hypothetical protein